MKTHEQLLKKIKEIQEKIDELDKEEELEKYRKECREFGQKLKIMQEETGLSMAECLNIMEMGLKYNE